MRRPNRRCTGSCTRKSGSSLITSGFLGRTRDWLRYEVPQHWIKREWRGSYKGQKQIWYLLRLVGRDNDVSLRATDKPEFDAWRWHDYWIPLEAVIEFKRESYRRALLELERFLHAQAADAPPAPVWRAAPRNARVLRRSRDADGRLRKWRQRMPGRRTTAAYFWQSPIRLALMTTVMVISALPAPVKDISVVPS